MIVLKIGGDVFERGLGPNLSADIKEVLETSKLVIVHGGGDEVTRVAEKLGKKQVFIYSPSGIRSRYTDRETAEIYTMVMAGKINKNIVRFLLGEGIKAVGLSGVDATLLRAKRKKRLIIVDERGRKRIIDGGYTGKIEQVNTQILKLLMENGYVPVVSPTAIGEENYFLNVDSDRAAASIAGALKAEKVIFLTDVEGIFLEGKLVRRISLKEAEEIMSRVGPGMDKKVMASIEALKAGVGEAIIASGLVDKPVISALNHLTGTVIYTE